MDEGLSSGVSPDGGLELARTPRQSPPQVYTPRPDSWLPPRSGTYSSPKPPRKLTSQKGIYPRHFGLVLPTKEDWEKLVTRAKEKGLKFYQEPKQRFPQQLTEHWTFFLEDPFYNLLEFKYYTHDEAIFGGSNLEGIGDR